MEDLLKNDATFDISHSSADGIRNCTNWDRTLLNMPSERSSFQVDLGFDGYSNFFDPTNTGTDATGTGATGTGATGTGATGTKPKYDPEKVAGAITSGAGAISSVGTTIQAFKDPNKQPSRRKQLKDVCGKKPLLKKNRATYDKCVADYNAGKTGGTTTRQADTTPTTNTTEETPQPNNTKKIVIGLVVVGLVVTAFIGYKKGWFGGKPA